MRDTSARIFHQTVEGQSKAGWRHKHSVTTLVECDCGCAQEELFPMELVYTSPPEVRRPTPADGADARDRLGAPLVGNVLAGEPCSCPGGSKPWAHRHM